MVMGAVSPADSSDCRKYGVEGWWGWGGGGGGWGWLGVGVVRVGGGETGKHFAMKETMPVAVTDAHTHDGVVG